MGRTCGARRVESDRYWKGEFRLVYGGVGVSTDVQKYKRMKGRKCWSKVGVATTGPDAPGVEHYIPAALDKSSIIKHKS